MRSNTDKETLIDLVSPFKYYYVGKLDKHEKVLL